MRLQSALRRVIAVLALIYVFLQIAPQIAFLHEWEDGRFTVYSDRPIGASEILALSAAKKKIEACPFDDPAMRHDVFLCHEEWRFRVFTPFSVGALGITNVFGNSFVKPGTKRSLASLIAHERVHDMLARRYGRLWSLKTPDWKEEGVCEYYAGDITFDVKAGKDMLLAGKSEDSGPFQYFKYWFMVRHLIDVEGMTSAKVFETNRGEAEVLRAAVEALRQERIAIQKEKPTEPGP